MAADGLTTRVLNFVKGHLEAERDVEVAATREPDDDRYLDARASAQGFYAQPPADSGLTPLEPEAGRSAVPGGTTALPFAGQPSAATVGHVYALAAQSDGTWVAFVGGRRDPSGAHLAGALAIEEVEDGELKIVGRAAYDTLGDSPVWMGAGGRDVSWSHTGTGMHIDHLPTDPDHARVIEEAAP